MSIKLKVIIPFILLTLLPIFLLSQKNSHHPFSRYGIGEIEQEGFAQNKALGGISAGLDVNNKINYQNPAAYTSQDTNSFIFDVGLKTAQNKFSSENANMIKNETNLSYMAIGFPVTSKWKSSIGILPYSNTGYNLSITSETALGTKNYGYDGKGGLRKFYIGNAYELTNKLSIGLNYIYQFGTIENTSSIQWRNPEAYQFENLLTKKKLKVNSHVFNLGLQYKAELFKNYDLTLGASYEISPGFKGEKSTMHITNLDTASLAKQKFNKDYPSNFLVGFSLSNNKLLWGADFQYTKWSNLSNFSNITDSYSLHTGLQYIPDRGALKNYLKKINYRVGAYYKNGYYTFDGETIKDFGITFGLGLPLKYKKTNFNISCQLGQKGKVGTNLIEKRYAIINVGITFFDFWFVQQKYQ
jgi:hypothetical protein